MRNKRQLLVSYLKGGCWRGVEVEHVAGGGWCGGVWSDGNTGFRLAKSGRVEELGGSLETVGRRKRLSHGIQTHSHSLVDTHE